MVLLAGCSSIPYATPGPNDPKAFLTIGNRAQYAIHAYTHHDPKTCEGVHSIATGRGSTINQNELGKNSEFVLPIHADKPFGLWLTVSRPDPSRANYVIGCDQVVTFTPQRDISYLAEFIYEPPRCVIRVSEDRAGAQVPVPVLYRKQMPTSLARPSTWCSP